MTSIKNILVGYNGFEHREPLSRLALTLAKEQDATLHLINVVPPIPALTWRQQKVSPAELQTALIRTRKDQLDYLLLEAKDLGIRARSFVRVGVPHIELIREARDCAADLVVVSDALLADGLDGSDKRGFGPVTAKLQRECPCPVLANRKLLRSRHKTILAAVDVRTTDDKGLEKLNLDILNLAVQLARTSGPTSAGAKQGSTNDKSEQGTVLVFHAWELWGEHLLRSQARMREEEVEKILEETRHQREQALASLLSGTDRAGVSIESVVKKGNPRLLLPSIVDEREVDLVVMGTICRTGVKGFLIGNTAEKILSELKSSVLTVKPPGFVSVVD